MKRPIDDIEVALAIDISTRCKAFGCLPRSGGLLDQDSYHVMLLTAGFRAIAIKEERDNAPKRRT